MNKTFEQRVNRISHEHHIPEKLAESIANTEVLIERLISRKGISNDDNTPRSIEHAPMGEERSTTP